MAPAATLAVAVRASACAGSTRDSTTDASLRYVGFELPFGENVLLHCSRRQMPLRVHLPLPDAGFYADPVAVHDVVRDGVLDWADVVGPGVPGFVFVDSAGEADIPIAWALDSPDPRWYVAHCIYSRTIVSNASAASASW